MCVRVAVFQVRLPRLGLWFAHVFIAKPQHSFTRHALGINFGQQRVPGKQRRQRFCHDHEIQRERPFGQIFDVEGNSVPIADVVVPAGLPMASQAGTDGHVGIGIFTVVRQLFFGNGARPDEAHLTLQHVDQLRKLVEARSPQNIADDRDVRVGRCVGSCRPKLEAAKFFSLITDPAMGIENRAPIT